MEHIAFPPWVGKRYAETGYKGKKILVLGESHYCGDCESCKEPNDKCNITINIIIDYLNYKNGAGEFAACMNTYTRFTNVFVGEKCGAETVHDFWNSVVFYNYVQKSIDGPRESPTRQMFQESEPAFFEILNEYTPDIIIVWGERLWNNLPDTGYWGKNYILDEQGGKLYYYKAKTKDIPAYRIYHPSTTYCNYEYTKYLKELMNMI